MAADFWRSSHYQLWLKSADDVASVEQRQAEELGGMAQMKAMHIHLCGHIEQLLATKPLNITNQQIAATAIVYIKRFYYTQSWFDVHPIVLATTAAYLAQKAEEFGLVHVRKAIDAARSHFGDKWPFGDDVQQAVTAVVDCEYILAQEMDCSLVVFQPYRSLQILLADSSHKQKLMQTAWNLVNDSLRTHMCMIYPPSLIALSCIHLAATIQGLDISGWMAELAINTSEVVEATQYLLNHFMFLRDEFPSIDISEVFDRYFERQRAEHEKQRTRPSTPRVQATSPAQAGGVAVTNS